jgi:ATP-dependent helicase HrpA
MPKTVTSKRTDTGKADTSRKKTGASRRQQYADDLLNRAVVSCAPGLPVCALWDELVKSVQRNQVIIVAGETGCGKTTQLPKICLAAGRGRQGKIVCTQPRRVAAMTVAARLAEELGPAGPALVGYRIRFKDRTGPHTRIKFATDGMLLAELQRDRRLKQYDTVIVDEAHERSLNIDFILGVLRELLPARPDLKVIITSATMDTERFSLAFGNAPVIKISGRGYPVEIRYRPQDLDEELGDTVVEQVVSAVDDLRREDPSGDILVFLPTERDIQETVNLLSATHQGEALVLPMFGRLAAADQQRIFKPSPLPKIIVATNVAETSITVPGIRYVVDSGLARISRYNVRSRTKALPVTPISRASADQRSGRAGRVQAGVCVRLYGENDYLERPLYTPPEIVRSNLAEVILRLAAMELGPVTDFPFIDPPSPTAVREGFTTLRELGALDAAGKLTKTGVLMARLPLDPRISRMILQARHENALEEVAIIAAALSIQDPRERPLGKEPQADQAHSGFKDNSSDFVGFINIWNAFHRELEDGRSRSQMRRFCKEKFLSYNRMREWKDIQDQILSILSEAGGFDRNPAPARYAAIHRSILAGFLGHIALHQEGPRYLAARGKEVYLFPGSSLYKKRPKWMVAAELVRTSQLFARTAAAIEPEWIESLAGDLALSSYSEPHWEKRRGEVVAWQRVTVFGLPVVERRTVAYGRINPEEARDIFIRQALIPGELRGRYQFLTHNLRMIAEARDVEDRTRRRDLVVSEDVLYAFYEKQLSRLGKECVPCGSEGPRPGRRRQGIRGPIHDERTLARALRLSGMDAILQLTKEDLLNAAPQTDELALFPGHLTLSGNELDLRYRFSPGDAGDGVTVRIPVDLVGTIPERAFEWVVPGLLQEKISFLLKSLPKRVRRKLVPIPESLQSISADLEQDGKGLFQALEDSIFRQYGIKINRTMWPDSGQIPRHLLMRFEIVDPGNRVLAQGRDLGILRKRCAKTTDTLRQHEPGWLRLRQRWEYHGLSLENLPDLPQSVTEDAANGNGSIIAFSGLVAEGDGVAIRLFPDPAEALERTQEGARRLLSDVLAKELAYLKKNCIPSGLPLAALLSFGGEPRLRSSVFAFLCRELLGAWDHMPSKAELLHYAAERRRSLYREAVPVINLLEAVFEAHVAARKEIDRFAHPPSAGKVLLAIAEDLNAEITRLTPPDFPARATTEELTDLPRYLRALSVRAQRAYAAPLKDRTKAARMQPHLTNLARAAAFLREKEDSEAQRALKDFRMLVEEYRISVFAPELGTVTAVSPKRLGNAWEQLCSFL